jgi:two-component system chemotaxis response regulator CheY
MPNMTGVEFVVEVRKFERKMEARAIPLVMVTSEKTMSKVQEALDQAGADGFISKPFTVEEMQRRLKKHVDQAQMVRARKEREKQPAPAAAPAKPAGGWFNKMFS